MASRPAGAGCWHSLHACRLALVAYLPPLQHSQNAAYALDQQVHSIISETAPLPTAHKLHEELMWRLLQAQKALLDGQPHMTEKGTRVDYLQFSDRQPPADVADMLKQQPELKHLPRAVALFLAGYPEADPGNPEATLLENLPQLPNVMVGIQ